MIVTLCGGSENLCLFRWHSLQIH